METKTQTILISLVVFFLGSNLLGLGITAVITSSNPIAKSNVTVVDQCEDKLINSLNGWGISAMVFGSLFLIWFCIQSAVFILKNVYSSEEQPKNHDFGFIWGLNLCFQGIISLVLYIFALIFLGIELFGDICIDKIRYYYWSVGCAIFINSTIFVAFIFGLFCISSSKFHKYICNAPR